MEGGVKWTGWIMIVLAFVSMIWGDGRSLDASSVFLILAVIYFVGARLDASIKDRRP